MPIDVEWGYGEAKIKSFCLANIGFWGDRNVLELGKNGDHPTL